MPGVFKSANKPTHITKGGIFEDLALTRAEAVEARVKADLWRDLVSHIEPLELPQKQLASRLGVHQPEVSNLLSGKLSKFSAGALIHFAVELGLDVSVKLSVATRPAVVKSLSAVGSRRSKAPASAA